MTAVRGGQDNQAIGTSQSNVQVMLAAANVGNGSFFGGPTEHPVGQHLQPGRHQHEHRDQRRRVRPARSPGPGPPLLNPSKHLQARTDMKSLHISDLSVSNGTRRQGHDAPCTAAKTTKPSARANRTCKACSPRRTSATAPSSGGPTNIQSDNTFSQDATNTNTATNVDFALFASAWACRSVAESASGEVGVAADPHPTAGPRFRERHHEHHDHH